MFNQEHMFHRLKKLFMSNKVIKLLELINSLFCCVRINVLGIETLSFIQMNSLSGCCVFCVFGDH